FAEREDRIPHNQYYDGPDKDALSNDPSVDKYATASQETPFVRELIRRCATLPGVEEVALGDPAAIPLDTTQHELNVLEGHVYLTFEGQNVDQQKPTLVQRGQSYARVLSLARADAAPWPPVHGIRQRHGSTSRGGERHSRALFGLTSMLW